MANIAKFLFDTDFETAGAMAGAPDAKLMSGKAIQDLRDSAFAAGVNEGAAREKLTTDHRQSEALAVIANRLEAITQTQDQAINQIIEEATKLTMAITRKISPALARHEPLFGIEAIIREFLHQLIDEPHIVVRVPDGLIDHLKQRIDDIATECGFAGRVVLMPDPMMNGNDCRLEWADGGAVRNLDTILDEIETGVARLLQNPTELSGNPPADGSGQPAEVSR